MFRTTHTVLIAVLALAGPAGADSFTGSNYTAKDLLDVCQEADNDARLLGQAAEVECEQYVIGFADALREVGATGPEAGVCPPEVNTADEIRWAFMRWVHADFSNRKAMPASGAVLGTLRDSFPCP